MINTKESTVSKKLRIKFATKRIEVQSDAKSSDGENFSLNKEYDDRSSMKELSKPAVCIEQNSSSIPGSNNKRRSSSILENQNPKRRKMDRNVAQQCSQILKKLISHPAGWVFNAPVDPVKLNIPDYFSVISDPMDLGTIKSNLEKNLYCSPGEFASDVRLTFSNAMLYNPASNNVHIMAKELNDVFSISFMSLDSRLKSGCLESDAGQVLNGRAKKTNVTKMNCQKTPLLSASVPNRSTMSFEERKKLRMELLVILRRKILPHLRGTLQKFGLSCQSDLVSELNNDSLDEECLLELRKVTRSVNNARSTELKPAKTVESCRTESLKSINIASPKCSLCGNIKCQCRVHDSSSDLTSDSSMIIPEHNDAPKISKQETHSTCRQVKLSQGINSDPDSDGSVSAGDDGNIRPSSQCTTDTIATSGEDLMAPVANIPLSPKRALRAAMLKSRFADTILKAQHKTLRPHGDITDSIKIHQEKERLEKKQLEEKARIEAEIRAAEAASRKKAETELKMQRQKEREAARIALEKMEKTVQIVENIYILKDLEMLNVCSPSGHYLDASEIEDDTLSTITFISPRVRSPLERLGLFMKDEYLGDEDDEDLILNKSCEDGEIIQ